MNTKQLGFIRIALLIAIWSYVFDGLLGWSAFEWIGGIAIILATIAVNIDLCTKIGEAIASFAIAIYKFMLRPLIGRWLGQW